MPNPKPIPFVPRAPRPSEVAAASALATLGALPLGQAPDGEEAATPEEENRRHLMYAVGSMAGAGLGGGAIGYVAAGDTRGMFSGSLLTFGMAGIANGVKILRRTDQRTLGGAVGVAGLLGIGAAIFLASRRGSEGA